MAIVRLATIARNAAANAVVDLLDAGSGAATIQIRSGTMPATPQDAATGTLLVTVTLADPAAGDAASGAATIVDPAVVTAVAAGTASWARFRDSNGAAVMDCDVTVTGGGGALTLSSVSITSGGTVNLGAITFTVPQG